MEKQLTLPGTIAKMNQLACKQQFLNVKYLDGRELSWKTYPSGYICENGSRLNAGSGPKSDMPPIDRLYEARLNSKSGLQEL